MPSVPTTDRHPFDIDGISEVSTTCLQSSGAALKLERYTDAVAQLDSTNPSQHELPQIVIRRSEIFIAQRDFKSARQTLDSALADIPDKPPSSLGRCVAFYDLLRLIRVYVGIFHELKLREAVEWARTVKARWLDAADCGEYDEMQIQMELWWQKVIKCNSIMNFTSNMMPGEEDVFRERRLSLIRSNLQSKGFVHSRDLLMDVVKTELTCIQSSAQSWVPILETLTAFNLSEPDNAFLHYTLAGKWNELHKRDRCIEELRIAEEHYAMCGHATGAYKVQYSNALWNIVEDSDKIHELRAVANGLLQGQDYLGATNALQSLAETMERAGYNRRAIFDVHSELVSISQQCENWMMALRWLLSLLQTDSRSQGDGHVLGAAVELCEAAHNILEGGSMPLFSSRVSVALSGWYVRKHDHTAAIKQAWKALSCAEDSQCLPQISEAQAAIAYAESKILRPEYDDEWANVDSVKARWKDWLSVARAQYQPTALITLITVISELEFLQFKSESHLIYLPEIRGRIQEAEKALLDVEEEESRNSISAVLSGLKISLANLAGAHADAVHIAREAVTACGDDSASDEERATAKEFLALALFRLYETNKEFSTLEKASEEMKKSKDGFEALGDLRASAICCKFLAMALLEKNGVSQAREALAYLEMADYKLGIVSQEAAVLRDVHALLCRQKIRNESHIDIYANAITACLRIDDDIALWIWSQRSKGRALLDMLGIDDWTPPILLDSIAGNTELESLLEEERDLVAKISQKALSERYVMRNQHKRLVEKMKLYPELAANISLRQPIVVDWNDLGDNFQGDPRIVFVDWIFTTPRRGSVAEIFMLTIRPHQRESLRKTRINLTIEEIETWRAKFLKARIPFPKGTLHQYGQDFFAPLNALIGPLESEGLSHPEDLLVLCPTGCLYDIPLHAIPIGKGRRKAVLLKRNPVMYCQNFSMLRLSNFRVQQVRERAEAKWNPVVFGDPITTGYRPGSVASERLAEKLGVRPRLGRDVTPKRFCDEVPDSSLILYHGHAQSSNKNVLDETVLCLSSPDETSSEGSPLPAKLIFSLKLKYAPHVTLLACQTSQQEVSSGDELMGLVPAFLFAGASSVLGSLWPVENESAVRFALKFYDQIFNSTVVRDMKQNSGDVNGSSIVVDIARAMRSAALEIRSDEARRTDSPYYWAGYVLYGSNSFTIEKDTLGNYRQ